GGEGLRVACLILGVEGEVDPGRQLESRAMAVERDVRPDAVVRTEEHEVIAVPHSASHVTECGRPELRLPLEVVDAQDDRSDPEHCARQSSADTAAVSIMFRDSSN